MESLHPNWKALATVDFEHRIFVRGQNKIDIEEPKESKYKEIGNLSGEEAKNYYMEVISGPSLSSISTIKPNHCNKIIDDRVTVVSNTPLDLSERLVNNFLLAAQENNCDELKDIYVKCPNVLDATDDFGWTALMCAVQSSSLEAVQFLLKQQANVEKKDKIGKTALSLAKNNKRILNLFKQAKTRSGSNVYDRQCKTELFCDVCQQNFYAKDKKNHLTSTLHVFNVNKNKKLKTIYGIPENNRGYQILLRTGWNKDNGLGPRGCGNKYPIKTVLKRDRHGLGSETGIPRVTHNPNSDEKLHRIETHKTLNKKYKKHMHSKDKFIERDIRRELS